MKNFIKSKTFNNLHYLYIYRHTLLLLTAFLYNIMHSCNFQYVSVKMVNL